MTRATNRLTAVQIKNATPGKIQDGGGPILASGGADVPGVVIGVVEALRLLMWLAFLLALVRAAGGRVSAGASAATPTARCWAAPTTKSSRTCSATPCRRARP